MAGGGGEEFQGNRRIKVRLPDDLRSYPSRSWVSAGGATLFNEVPPVSTSLEERIITGLLTDLNNKFDLGLDTKPNLTRASAISKTTKPRILVIGGSHAGRTGDEFEERGCSGSAAQAGDLQRQLSKKSSRRSRTRRR